MFLLCRVILRYKKTLLIHQKSKISGDDNDLIGNVVYSAAKDYAKNPDDDLYKAKLSKALSNALRFLNIMINEVYNHIPELCNDIFE